MLSSNKSHNFDKDLLEALEDDEKLWLFSFEMLEWIKGNYELVIYFNVRRKEFTTENIQDATSYPLKLTKDLDVELWEISRNERLSVNLRVELINFFMREVGGPDMIKLKNKFLLSKDPVTKFHVFRGDLLAEDMDTKRLQAYVDLFPTDPFAIEELEKRTK